MVHKNVVALNVDIRNIRELNCNFGNLSVLNLSEVPVKRVGYGSSS